MKQILLVLLFAVVMVSATQGADTSFVYAKCNAKGIEQGSPFWGNLGTTLQQLAENTAYAGYDFKTQNGGAKSPACGEAVCNKLISPTDCTLCLEHLSQQIWGICNDAIGAEISSPLADETMKQILLVLLFAVIMVSATQGADTSFVYAKCNAKGIEQGSPFWGNLGTTLQQLAENTAYAGYDFKTQNGGAKSPACGEAVCNKLISPTDCTLCLEHLSQQIWGICNDAIGAEVQFADCSIHYESFSF